MITVILLCYLGCLYAIFKVVKIPVNPKTVAISVLVGFLMLGGIVIGWKFAAPMTEKITTTRGIIPIGASQNTKNPIAKIHVVREQLVQKGDPLFEVDKRPFQLTVNQRMAQLEEAKQRVEALESAVKSAAFKVDQAASAVSAAQANYDVGAGMLADDKGAVSILTVKKEEYTLDSAKAALDMATASLSSEEFALESARNSLKSAEAQLKLAQLELDRTIIRAPVDGSIVNLQIAEGTMTTTVITSAQAAFQDMSKTFVLAIFRQNLVKNVASGDRVEIAFKNYPGHIATGIVDTILEFTGEGQIKASGILPVAANIGSKGFLAVRIKLDDKNFARELPLGASGATAIYTQTGKPFHVITKITVRIKSWLYNLPI